MPQLGPVRGQTKRSDFRGNAVCGGSRITGGLAGLRMTEPGESRLGAALPGERWPLDLVSGPPEGGPVVVYLGPGTAGLLVLRSPLPHPGPRKRIVGLRRPDRGVLGSPGHPGTGVGPHNRLGQHRLGGHRRSDASIDKLQGYLPLGLKGSACGHLRRAKPYLVLGPTFRQVEAGSIGQSKLPST